MPEWPNGTDSRSVGLVPSRVRIPFPSDFYKMFKKEEAAVKCLKEDWHRETVGWMLLGERALKKVWSNPKDEVVWKNTYRYHR